MGRGRKGIINQSTKKLAPRSDIHNIAMIFRPACQNCNEIKVSLQEDAIEFMRNMNSTTACRFSFVK